MGTRYLSLMLNDVRLDIYNDWLGKETVLYNGEIMSQKSSILGERHEFYAEENGEEVRYEVNIFLSGFRVAFDIFRNNEALMLG